MNDKLKKFISNLGSEGLKYQDPRDLNSKSIDKKLRKSIININKSNWCWTLFSCQGHSYKNKELSLPYLVFVVKNKYINKFISLIYLTLPKSNNKKLPLHTIFHFSLSRGYSDDDFTIFSIHWSENYVNDKKAHARLISDLTFISKQVKM